MIAFLSRFLHFLFLLPLRVIFFFYRLAFSYLGILVLALIRVYFYFPAHEVLSSEIARVDILADPPASTDVVSSGFCTNSPSQVYMHPFSVLLAGIYLCYLLTQI
jgi:hypothetical protein